MAKQKSAGEEYPLILGYEVYNSDSEKIGQVEETYHGTTGLVEWLGVRGDGSARRLVLLPLKTAQIQGSKVYIPYSKEEVMTAPEPDDDGHVPVEAERWLYAHQKSQAPEQEYMTSMWERRKASRQAQQNEEGS
jgi:sporulation protein YlmC with PRC-barrel domain